jgi:hypothetical protein
VLLSAHGRGAEREQMLSFLKGAQRKRKYFHGAGAALLCSRL